MTPIDAQEVARTFGLGRRPLLSAAPVARGKQGEIWRLETDEGPWAVKLTAEPMDAAAAERSAALQEAARAAGVPTPCVKRTHHGAATAELSGRQVRVYSWELLEGPDSAMDPILVGSAVGLMHRIAPAPEAVPAQAAAWSREPVGVARWQALVEDLKVARAPFADHLANLYDELIALEEWLEDPVDPRMCHSDLWADNVLPTTTGGVCIVDWDQAGVSDPSHELAVVTFEFARDDPRRLQALHAAYEDAGGTGSLDRPQCFTMVIAQLGQITELAGRRWLAARTAPDRTAAERWIREVFDDPHTRARLEELLRTR